MVKFSGCYHRHADSLLVKAGFGAATFGVPDLLGVTGDFARHTLIAELLIDRLQKYVLFLNFINRF